LYAPLKDFTEAL